MRYTVTARRQEGGGYLVGAPDFDVEEVCAPTTTEALRAAAGTTLLAALQACIDGKKPLPRPVATPEQYKGTAVSARWIRLPLAATLKLAAYQAWLYSGITYRALAEAAGMSEPGLKNFFNLDKGGNLTSLALIVDACKVRVNVGISWTPDTTTTQITPPPKKRKKSAR